MNTYRIVPPGPGGRSARRLVPAFLLTISLVAGVTTAGGSPAAAQGHGVVVPAAAAVAGRVIAWGDDTFGQSRVPAGLDDVVAVAAGDHRSLALRADGTVFSWGGVAYDDQEPAPVPPGLRDVVAITAGHRFSAALRSDGTVVTWGEGLGGWCPTPPPEKLRDVVAIDAGGGHLLALRRDGSVVSWGSNADNGRAEVPAGVGDLAVVAGWQDGSYALRRDGTLLTWGAEEPCVGLDVMQASVPNCDRPYDRLTRQASHQVLNAAWGTGLTGRYTAVDTRNRHLLLLRPDGTVTARGSLRTGTATVPLGLGGVTTIAAGTDHALALRGDGTVLAWGRNPDRDRGQSNVPPGLDRVIAVAAGAHHSLAIITAR